MGEVRNAPIFCGVTVMVHGGEEAASWEVAGNEWDGGWNGGGWTVCRNGEQAFPSLATLGQAIAFSLGFEAGRRPEPGQGTVR